MTPAWEEGETLQSQREDRIIYGPLAKPLSLPPEEMDLVREVLALNTSAMERCRDSLYENALQILDDALYQLNPNVQEDPDAVVLRDLSLRDQLTATTLNNIGVVESHRGQPREALLQFERARELENNWNIASPSVSVNMSAAYNSLKQYDRASAAALETIDMLRALEVQRREELRLRKKIEARRTLSEEEWALVAREEEEELEMLNNRVRVSDIENAALWGAAWHNLGVAQVNTVRVNSKKNNTNAKNDPTEVSNALRILQNAMKATQDLLGLEHPMTVAVTETYRAVRKTLREGGAFQQHRNLMTAPLPPVDPCEREKQYRSTQPANGATRHRTLVNQQKDLTITFKGKETKGKKFTERAVDEAYPKSFKRRTKDGKEGERSRSKGHSRSRDRTTTTMVPKRLQGAAELYGSSASSSHLGGKGGSSRKAILPAEEKERVFPALNTTYQHTSESRPHRGVSSSPVPSASNTSTPPTPPPLLPPPKQPIGIGTTTTATTGTGTSTSDKKNSTAGVPKKGRASTSTVVDRPTASAPSHSSTGGKDTLTESSRFLLLAQSSPSPSRTVESSVEKKTVDTDVQTDMPPVEGYVTSSGEATPTNSEAYTATSSSQHPPRELFDAMWVSADDKYISKGNRSFGTPAYYVPDIESRVDGSRRASTLPVTPEQEGRIVAGGSAPSSGQKNRSSSIMVYDESDGSTVFIRPPPSPSQYREL